MPTWSSTKVDGVYRGLPTKQKKQGAWKHSQELGRAKRASENLQDENDDLQKEVDRVNKNFSALQDQHDKLQESKQEVMIERGTLHERIMDLEAEVRKVKETNRALQRSAPPSHPRAFRVCSRWHVSGTVMLTQSIERNLPPGCCCTYSSRQ